MVSLLPTIPTAKRIAIATTAPAVILNKKLVNEGVININVDFYLILKEKI